MRFILSNYSQNKITAKKQIARQWIKDNIRLPVEEIIKKLNVKLIGHYRYYGITDNFSRLTSYRNYVMWELYKRLKRRSQKKSVISISSSYQFNKLLLNIININIQKSFSKCARINKKSFEKCGTLMIKSFE